MAKSLHKVVREMYKYSNGQISLADFRQPVGMHLKEDNRWVKKAQTIPWLEIEQRYAALIVTKLRQTIAQSVAMSILLLNLRKIQYALLRLLAVLVLRVAPLKMRPLFS